MTLAESGAARILIADDEAPARARLRDLLDECRDRFPLFIVDEARNGREALEVINREKVDIVLLDIRMPDMDGMEAARHIAGMAEPPAIIFTTAFDANALKAFEVNAIDYLLKPIRVERLLTALKKTRAEPTVTREALDAAANQPRRHLSVHERGKIHLVRDRRRRAGLAERRGQPLQPDGLQQVVDRVHLEGLERVGVERGGEDDRRRLGHAGDVARRLHPVHLRHADVEQHDVDLLAVEHLEHLATVPRLVDDHQREVLAALVEQVAQACAGGRLVVGDQDARDVGLGEANAGAVM